MSVNTTCPVCSAELELFTIDGERIEACPVGHGMWLERDQLVAISEGRDHASPTQERAAWRQSDSEPEEMVTERFHTCPICAKTLRKDDWKYGSGVVVDVCEQHGIWVDGGEIERIEAWAEAWHAHAG